MVNADVEGDRLSVRNARTCGRKAIFLDINCSEEGDVGPSHSLSPPFLRARCPVHFEGITLNYALPHIAPFKNFPMQLCNRLKKKPFNVVHSRQGQNENKSRLV